MSKRILVINPGSTSTKIAIFDENVQVFVKTLRHSAEELSGFKSVADQYDFRKQLILEELKMNDIDLATVNFVIGRGGLIKSVTSGIYQINELMKEHLRIGYSGEHASNLGGLIADSIAQSIGLKEAYTADPVMVDEMQEIARISGHPLFERVSIFHALNQKTISRVYAKEHQKRYEDLNLIVAHMGGGISVGVHRKGLVVDVNQALDGEGPFSPERSGTLPMNQVVKACFSGKYTLEEVKKMLVGDAGYVAYFGSNDALMVENAALAGDPKAMLIEGAMAYQVGKEIAAGASVLEGQVDAIILTGGLAYGKPLVDKIKKYISWIAPVAVYPGEDEMRALAMNVVMMLNGELEVKNYE